MPLSVPPSVNNLQSMTTLKYGSLWNPNNTITWNLVISKDLVFRQNEIKKGFQNSGTDHLGVDLAGCHSIRVLPHGGRGHNLHVTMSFFCVHAILSPVCISISPTSYCWDHIDATLKSLYSSNRIVPTLNHNLQWNYFVSKLPSKNIGLGSKVTTDFYFHQKRI